MRVPEPSQGRAVLSRLFGVAILAGVAAIVAHKIIADPSGRPVVTGSGSLEKTDSATPALDTSRTAIDKSDAMQQSRKQLIEQLISEGLFLKVEVPGNLPRVYVRPAFYALDIDQKAKFISVVYAYYFDGTNFTDSVRIYDGHTGKEVGAYSAHTGGLRMF